MMVSYTTLMITMLAKKEIESGVIDARSFSIGLIHLQNSFYCRHQGDSFTYH